MPVPRLRGLIMGSNGPGVIGNRIMNGGRWSMFHGKETRHGSQGTECGCGDVAGGGEREGGRQRASACGERAAGGAGGAQAVHVSGSDADGGVSLYVPAS